MFNSFRATNLKIFIVVAYLLISQFAFLVGGVTTPVQAATGCEKWNDPNSYNDSNNNDPNLLKARADLRQKAASFCTSCQDLFKLTDPVCNELTNSKFVPTCLSPGVVTNALTDNCTSSVATVLRFSQDCLGSLSQGDKICPNVTSQLDSCIFNGSVGGTASDITGKCDSDFRTQYKVTARGISIGVDPSKPGSGGTGSGSTAPVKYVEYDPTANCPTARNAECVTCITKGGSWTGVGCLNTSSTSGIVVTVIRIAVGIMGGVFLLLMISAGYLYQTGQTENIEKAKQRITAMLGALIFLVFSVLLLRIIGINILDVTTLGVLG